MHEPTQPRPRGSRTVDAVPRVRVRPHTQRERRKILRKLLVPGGASDANSRGVLIPTTAVDQYGSTLAQWFGVPPASLPTAFPNIAKFGTSPLGFLA
jgi:hypothetical protein